MRQINLLIIHCSATKENQTFTLKALESHIKEEVSTASVITTTSANPEK